MIPYGRQDITQADIEAVVEVLRSDWITQGPSIDRFESLVADYCGARHAVAVSNGTAALHLSCLASGLGPGDWLWTSPNTFTASANCALYCGSKVDFVDIDPHTYNLSVSALAEKLSVAERVGRLPKVVIPVHFAGQSCEMEAIAELGERYGFRVIEDASHAVGGQYRGENVGCGHYSDMTVFSFHPVKIVTTAEGGMVLTNDDVLHQKLAMLRTHGITRDPSLMRGASHGAWYYQQIDLGYNYRITDIQAALGVSQMKRLVDFVRRRRLLAKRYDQAFKDLPLTRPWQHPDTVSAWHLYVIRLKVSAVGKSRATVFDELREAGIGVNVHYIPVHTQPFYRDRGFQDGDFPESETYYEEALSLPLYYGLDESQQDQVIDAVKTALP